MIGSSELLTMLTMMWCRYPDAFLYVAGSAGNGVADVANRAELDKWKIIPRMLRDATVRDLKVRMLSSLFNVIVLI